MATISTVVESKSAVADDRFQAGVDSAALPRFRLLPVAFVLIINLPMLASFLGLGVTPLGDLIHPLYVNRQPPWPASISDVPRFVTDSRLHFNKTHGFRADLMRAHAVVRSSVFKASPQPRVLVGADGWFFLNADGSLENYRRLRPYSSKELAQRVAEIRSRVEFCEATGCEYRLLVPPDKLSVYPEHLGDRFKIAQQPARIDQLVGALAAAGLDGVLIDSRTEMHDAKKYGQLYFKTDTHWNRLGAYVGYQAIAESLAAKGFRDVEPIHELVQMSCGAAVGGDLARMAGLRLDCSDQILSLGRRDAPEVNFTGPVDFFANDAAFFKLPTRDVGCEQGEFETGLVLHDSFGSPLLKYLAGHFQALRCERTTEFDEEAIRRTNPDVVIQVLVERALQRD